MNAHDKGDKQLQALNHCLQDRKKRDEDQVVGEQHTLVDDDQLKDNKISEDVKDGCEVAVQASAVLQIPQQQPQGAMVCWERFLHLRSLKVLLVENDDSTCHLVAALLRNCGYEVTEAANGLQAWKILEDLTNHIDIVLTEVVMPCLSGIGLLCKIMSHRTRKHVPVIMMSSLDSMGLVFKCLSRGAVDFLVKPIRKNELKNLWQHVWRRCHSSSGSGSESGTQTQKSVKSKSVEKSDNTNSNYEDDNGSIGLNVRDGSDYGSGTQSSWTKQDVEVDSPRVAECPDSTCAQVIHSNAEISGNRRVPMTAAKDCQEHVEHRDNIAKCNRDLDIGARGGQDLQLEYHTEVPIKLGVTKQNKQMEMGSCKFSEQIGKGQLYRNSESPSNKLKYEAADLTRGITKINDNDKENTQYDTSNKHSKILDISSKGILDSKELPSLELSLKRLRGGKDIGTTIQDDRNVLRRSDCSAFSRYNTASNANKLGGKIESASQVDNSLEVAKKGSVSDIRSHSNGEPLNQSSNGGSNNMDMGSTTDNTFVKRVGLKNKSEVSSTLNHLHSSSAFQTIKNDVSCDPQQVLSDKGDDMVISPVLGQPRGTHQELQIQHLTHHYDNCHHLVHNMQQQQLPHDHDQLSLKKMVAAVPHCGASNVLGGLVEGNVGYYSLNGSASGSNLGSNGQNGSSTAVNAGRMNVESDNGVAGKSRSGDASGSGSGNRVDQSKFAQREVTLTKFRQKRKERCFQKKVRYQSRKRLAEQRPRVRGQFVRRAANDSTSREAES